MANELVNADDADILDYMTTGVEGEREAADVAVHRMLAEETAKGRGGDAIEGLAIKDGEPETLEKDVPEKPGVQEPEESDSQRRRRLRRESEQRVRDESNRLRTENARLRERLRNVQARAPEPQHYDDQATYVADKAAHAAQTGLLEQALEESNERAGDYEQQAASLQQQAVSDYMSEGGRKYADFADTVQNPSLKITPAMAEALIDDGMHDTLYVLAKNPTELARIAALPTPLEQVKAIWKTQAALQARAADAKISKAPAPIRAVKGGGAVTAKNPSEMTYSEYVAWRTKKSTG